MLLALVVSAAPAYAYNGGSAANYADQYWQNYNSNYPNFSSGGTDCTNFVSQALHAGGFSMVNVGQNSSDDHNWWVQWNWFWGWQWSNSWSLVPDNDSFLMLHYPGGWYYGQMSGTTNTGTPNGLSRGDVLYYDWTNDGDMDHSTIQTVLMGTDPTSGWYGDLVDAHTTNRYHAIWTLEPYNAQAATTVITLVHVDPANT